MWTSNLLTLTISEIIGVAPKNSETMYNFPSNGNTDLDMICVQLFHVITGG